MADSSTKSIRFEAPLRSVRIRGDARTEAQREHDLREARDRGYQAAVAELKQSLTEEREQLAVLQEKTLQRLAEVEQQLHEEMEAALPELIVEGVRRVLPEVEITPELMKTVVRKLLEKQVADREGLIVYLPSRDRKLMEELQGELISAYPNIQFKTDPSLDPGDCLVRSRFGMTDARLDTKVNNLREALT